MTDLPPVTVLINTFRRPVALRDAIHCLFKFIRYPTDKVKFLIADDCGGIEFTGEYPDPRLLPTVSTPVNSGWGASANNAIAHIRTPYIFHIDDDFMLTRPLDLVEAVTLMETVPAIGMVRYAALARGERYTYQQHEANGVPYLILDKSSPSLYLYSQTPRLYGQRWFSRYGLFPETGLTLGEAEEHYCHHVKDIMNADDSAPQIAVFPEWIRDGFTIEREHSWQFTEYDVRHEVNA